MSNTGDKLTMLCQLTRRGRKITSDDCMECKLHQRCETYINLVNEMSDNNSDNSLNIEETV